MNINVYTESTPNPATMKFIVNKLLINGSADYATKESAEKSLYERKSWLPVRTVNGIEDVPAHHEIEEALPVF